MFAQGPELWAGRAPNAELNAGAGQPCLFHSTVEYCPTVICLLNFFILVDYVFWRCDSSLDISANSLRSFGRYFLEIWIPLPDLLIYKAQQAQSQVLHWDEV